MIGDCRLFDKTVLCPYSTSVEKVCKKELPEYLNIE